MFERIIDVVQQYFRHGTRLSPAGYLNETHPLCRFSWQMDIHLLDKLLGAPINIIFTPTLFGTPIYLLVNPKIESANLHCKDMVKKSSKEGD